MLIADPTTFSFLWKGEQAFELLNIFLDFKGYLFVHALEIAGSVISPFCLALFDFTLQHVNYFDLFISINFRDDIMRSWLSSSTFQLAFLIPSSLFIEILKLMTAIGSSN